MKIIWMILKIGLFAFALMIGVVETNPILKLVFFAVAALLLMSLFRKRKEKSARNSINRTAPGLSVPHHRWFYVTDFLDSPPDRYVAFDLETTGLDPRTDHIIEIGAVYVEHGVIVKSFSQLVNPGIHIPEGATSVNHITDKMVKKAPRINQALSEFVAFIDDVDVLAAHNARFDADFLAAAAAECGIPLNVRFFDTLALAREAWPNLKNHKLGTVADKAGYSIDNAHRATADAQALPYVIEAAVKAIRRAEKRRQKAEDEA